MKTNIGITEKNREDVSALLAKLLADEHVLYMKTRNAHWNVKGPDFHAMHLFFEGQYGQIAEAVDEVAERIRALSVDAPGSLAEMLKLTTLKELHGAADSSLHFIQALLADHESIIRTLRTDQEKAADLGDDGTSDFLVGLMEEHEKMAWMLRASLA